MLCDRCSDKHKQPTKTTLISTITVISCKKLMLQGLNSWLCHEATTQTKKSTDPREVLEK